MNIPGVKTWTVRYWDGKKLLESCSVKAPTKVLAKLNHRATHWHEASLTATKVTYKVETPVQLKLDIGKRK